MESRGGILGVELPDIHMDNSWAEELHLAPGGYLRLSVSDTGAGIP